MARSLPCRRPRGSARPQFTPKIFPPNHPPIAHRPGAGFAPPQAARLPNCSPRQSLQDHRLARPAPPRPPAPERSGTAPPLCRYERSNPGELIHFDIKKLARIERTGHRITGDRQRDHVRGAGWEYLHIAIDDHCRIAFAQILPDEGARSAIAFLHAVLAFFAKLGIKAQRLYSDNGSCYRSALYRQTIADLGLKQRFTRPYTPRTNGKAERFIQTSLREWAYAHAYSHSTDRSSRLPSFLHNYNWHRPHHSLNLLAPISRLHLPLTNLLSLHS